MTTFDSREQAFENRFVHDQDLAFRAAARRSRAVAQWAGGLLGKSGEEQERYTADVMAAAIEGGAEAVARKLIADLAPVHTTEHQVRGHMDLEFAKAMAQVKAE